MAKGENQKLKLLYLEKIFRERTDCEHPMTVEEFISALREYGISAERKSIYTDIEALREYGLDIERVQKKSFGYYLASTAFELPELKLLVDAVQSSRFITSKKSSQLIGKLETLTSRNMASQLQRQVYVSNRVKTANETIYYTVDALHTAIAQNRRITFQYYDWNVKKEKELRHNGQLYCVSPFALSWAEDNYYLVAYDSATGSVRHYRVDKMLGVTISDLRRDGHEVFCDFDMAIYARQTFGMFSGEETAVSLRCHNSLAGVMIDRFGEDITLIPQEDNTFLLTVRVNTSPMFYGWLAGFEGRVRPVSPQTVTENYLSFLQKNKDA